MGRKSDMFRHSLRALRRSGAVGLLLVPLLAGALWQFPARATNTARLLPAPLADVTAPGDALQTAVLAGGCFWGIQGVFEHVKGVRQVLAGYAGGEPTTAHYEMVSSGETGHAESVQIRFDPHTLSYGEILRIFFSVALDPTELDRQGPDTGTQYRSEIFALNPAQQRIAQAYIAQLGKARAFDRPIVTRVDALKGFYEAEAYHQDYLVRHPDSPYIVYNDQPKVEALRRLFPGLYVDAPTLALAAR
jgi:peptide-methionine (S)-S-oxide reductase